MHKRKSKTVTQAEIQARNGNLDAMELLARRYFDGRGVEQSHMWSFIWSSIATERGAKNLDSLSNFSFKRMSQIQRDGVKQGIIFTSQQLACS